MLPRHQDTKNLVMPLIIEDLIQVTNLAINEDFKGILNNYGYEEICILDTAYKDK